MLKRLICRVFHTLTPYPELGWDYCIRCEQLRLPHRPRGTEAAR